MSGTYYFRSLMKAAQPPLPDLYHIAIDGQIVTSKPLSLKELYVRHGGPKRIEAAGARLIPHKPLAKTDYLKDGQTTVPGVSSVGVEVRRADKRQPGAWAHGWARSTTPDQHLGYAKQYFRDRMKSLKTSPKPVLKSES